jgi:hypothetical protein
MSITAQKLKNKKEDTNFFIEVDSLNEWSERECLAQKYKLI